MLIKRFYILYVTILPIFLLAFSFCKKYPDDGKISMQTAKKRLRAHEWYFSKLYINDSDSTITHLKNIIPNSNIPGDLSFKIIDGINCKTNSGEMAFPFYPKPNSSYPDYSISMSIDKKKKNLTMGGPVIRNIQNPGAPPSTRNCVFWIPLSTEWEIIKLTKNDLHFKSSYNNYEVNFEFVK